MTSSDPAWRSGASAEDEPETAADLRVERVELETSPD
jgi:hypothetical protein